MGPDFNALVVVVGCAACLVPRWRMAFWRWIFADSDAFELRLNESLLRRTHFLHAYAPLRPGRRQEIHPSFPIQPARGEFSEVEISSYERFLVIAKLRQID